MGRQGKGGDVGRQVKGGDVGRQGKGGDVGRQGMYLFVLLASLNNCAVV